MCIIIQLYQVAWLSRKKIIRICLKRLSLKVVASGSQAQCWRCRKVNVCRISAETLHSSLAVGPTAAMTKQLWIFFFFFSFSRGQFCLLLGTCIWPSQCIECVYNLKYLQEFCAIWLGMLTNLRKYWMPEAFLFSISLSLLLVYCKSSWKYMITLTMIVLQKYPYMLM